MLSFSPDFAFVGGAAACPAKAGTRIGISVSCEKTGTGVDGYTIQAGAFKKVENAVRLTERLKNNHGLDATYFLASDKLFKVRFGNFTTKEKARQRAQSLKGAKIIEEFYIVQPEDYSVAKQKKYGTNYLRKLWLNPLRILSESLIYGAVLLR